MRCLDCPSVSLRGSILYKPSTTRLLTLPSSLLESTRVWRSSTGRSQAPRRVCNLRLVAAHRCPSPLHMVRSSRRPGIAGCDAWALWLSLRVVGTRRNCLFWSSTETQEYDGRRSKLVLPQSVHMLSSVASQRRTTFWNSCCLSRSLSLACARRFDSPRISTVSECRGSDSDRIVWCSIWRRVEY